MPPTPPTPAAQSRELKQRVLTCLHKLSDRDTYSAAALELESIAKTLSGDTLPLYLSSVSTTDASDKSPVRKQCLKLITILSQHHGNALSPYLAKLLSAVTRRLRDADSNVRAACITATASIAAHLTKTPFTLLMKPFLEALFTEQEMHSQIGAAMCLAAAVDAAPEPDVAALRKAMPRLEKLAKSDNFKAKVALLTLIGSVIGVGGAASQQMVRNLVPCLVELLSSKDWAARNAAAGALAKLAVVESDAVFEFKTSCLKIFEAKRFDKVKAVRETMNQTVAAWKEIPDLSDERSPPQESQCSSIEIVSDGRFLPGSKISITENGAKKTGPAMFRKLDHRKPSNQKISCSAPRAPSETIVSEDDYRGIHERELEEGYHDWDRLRKPETRRALFSKNSDEQMQKLNMSKAGSRVVPCLNERSESTVASNDIEDHSNNQKESEDLSLIRKQLVQIENQQSNLLDLLQRYIGRSESGMQSLESRVHGLELALDEISFDLAVSTRRVSNKDSAGDTCCKLPGTGFFSSKLWKRTEGQSSTSITPGSGRTPQAAALRNGDAEAFKLENKRYRFQGGRGIIVNPLAEFPNSHRISEASSSRVSTNNRGVV